jgi:uncharacterized membrane protein YkvI
MFLGGLIGSIIAYAILAIIQPDLFWAIVNVRKVSAVTQGMLSRSFYLLAGACASIFIGGIPGSIIGMMSRKRAKMQSNSQKQE